MSQSHRLFFTLATALVCAGCSSHLQQPSAAEKRAIGFLEREVPAWSRENGCFSCHNNGDAARALSAAKQQGVRISEESLRHTLMWVKEPERWEHNKGDPGFSDQRLAKIQFAASLLALIDSGRSADLTALGKAARKVAADQGADGSWRIDAQNPVGSPATYGTPLATFMAWRVLKRSEVPAVGGAITKAEAWLHQLRPRNVPSAAVILLFKNGKDSAALTYLRSAQGSDGGWGPFKESPAEAFDTALAMLALAEVGDRAALARGREFLSRQQQSDGSWPPTTRPSGGDSYAQKISTTGWATLALLRAREVVR